MKNIAGELSAVNFNELENCDDSHSWAQNLPTSDPPQSARNRLVRLAELAGDYHPPESLIKGLLPLNGIAWIYGLWGSFKSFVVLNIAVCVAGGLPWCGRATRQGGVVYLAGEGHRSVKHRLVALLQRYRLPATLPIWVSEKGGSLDDEGRDEILSLVRGLNSIIRLIIIDTQARWQIGDENSNSDSRFFVDAISKLADEFGATVLVVHHTGKDGKILRGAGNYCGAADAVLRVEKKVEDGERWALCKCEKLKDGDDNQFFSLRGEEMMLPAPWKDEYGEPISTLVFYPGEYQNRAKHRLNRAVIQIVAENPGCNQTELSKKISEHDNIGINKARCMLDSLVESGVLRCEHAGSGKAKCYYVAEAGEPDVSHGCLGPAMPARESLSGHCDLHGPAVRPDLFKCPKSADNKGKSTLTGHTVKVRCGA